MFSSSCRAHTSETYVPVNADLRKKTLSLAKGEGKNIMDIYINGVIEAQYKSYKSRLGQFWEWCMHLPLI